jgi:hypothetical protein
MDSMEMLATNTEVPYHRSSTNSCENEVHFTMIYSMKCKSQKNIGKGKNDYNGSVFYPRPLNYTQSKDLIKMHHLVMF